MKRFFCIILLVLLAQISFSKTFSIHIYKILLNGNTYLYRVYENMNDKIIVGKENISYFYLRDGFVIIYDSKGKCRIYGGGFFIELEED